MTAPPNPRINVKTYYYPPSVVGTDAPAVIVQVTVLVDTYMVWAGTCDPIPGLDQPSSSLLEDTEENNHDQGGDTGVHPRVRAAIREGRLAKDWACAMPPTNPSVPSSATALFRSNDSDVVSMAQRLARRWKKQIFLSVDVPHKFEQVPMMGLEVEKRVVESLKRTEG